MNTQALDGEGMNKKYEHYKNGVWKKQFKGWGRLDQQISKIYFGEKFNRRGMSKQLMLISGHILKTKLSCEYNFRMPHFSMTD